MSRPPLAAQIERVRQTLPRWLREMREALRFLSRFPLPPAGPEAAAWPLARVLRWAPVAGLAIAIGPSAVLLLGTSVALPSLATVTLSIAAMMATTGALHEDGLADLADGFGGGRTPERKLAIMRDSRIGTFGALALITSLILRIASLQQLLEHRGALASGAALILVAAFSRGLMLVPMTLLPRARSDGLAHAAGAVTPASLGVALALGLILAGMAAWLGHLPTSRCGIAAVVAGLASLAVSALARRQIGGVTGDVVGATQQATEIALLLALSAGPALL